MLSWWGAWLSTISRFILVPGHGLSNIRAGEFDTGASSSFGSEHEIVSTVSTKVAAHYFLDPSAEFSVVEAPYCSSYCLPRHPLRRQNPDSKQLVRAGHLSYLVGTFPKRYKNGWLNQNYVPGDFILSLHMNGFGQKATGAEVLYSNEAPPIRVQQARAAAAAIADVLKLRNRGAKSDNESAREDLTILDDTQAPALLLELGFVNNPQDVMAVRNFGPEAVIAAMHAIRSTR